MHDFSAVYLLIWLYFIIPAILVFLLIWFFTKNSVISYKIKLIRVLPFSILLSPALFKTTGVIESDGFPAIVGFLYVDVTNKTSYLYSILVTTMILWWIYILLNWMNDHLSDEVVEREAFEQKNREDKIKVKIQNINRGL